MPHGPRLDTATGRLGDWLWVEGWAVDLYCPDIVRIFSSRFVDRRAVCTSWDSGWLDPEAARLQEWSVTDGHAVSPPITASLAEAWPESSCGFDEWYFFGSVPEFTGLQAVCNWEGMSLAVAPNLRGVGFDLVKQLDLYQPWAVVGDGQRVFVITRDASFVADVAEECRRRRTRG